MNQKFMGRLSDEKRGICQQSVRKLKRSSQKIGHPLIRQQANAEGPA